MQRLLLRVRPDKVGRPAVTAPRGPLRKRHMRGLIEKCVGKLRAAVNERLFRFRASRCVRQTLDWLPNTKEILRQRSGLPRPEGRLVLGVVGGCPIIEYIRRGYDSLPTYYSPLLLFDEVHYFQNRRPRVADLPFGYPFHVHRFESASDIVSIGRSAGFSVLRAYDAPCGRVAIDAAKSLDIPAIVSIH